ncbi:S-layer homology domain-containing protein [Maledivibacter halophilus]|uniref:S-layer homology domain-containing protein n=1 Tax=Maledivibacter halophilus TaxID=36842 RepID=A0A1T5K3I2_9FIRM|nr:S-layer homology domain-containing protein [Maledivibacter halophilus]SKC58134.1 S-layer homology domain-containing protein [Maledivibacter halophilus]
MRKILSLVLVLSMVLGSFGFAFAAPADVEGTDYEDAVTRLIALEIVSGYDDGEFKPEKTITRAEFAKIMIHAVGVGESAQYSKGATAFSDVPAGHWASGYINQAAGMEIINGRGDGTFGPEDKVTYAQAVTMIVRALGYEPKAQAMGGYPNGYLAVAAEEDITDDISFADASAATRGDVAKMVDASLDVNLMYQATWGDTPEYKNDDDDKTLLKTKLHIDEIEGVVTAVPNIKSSLKDNEIEVDSEDDGSDIYELLIGDVNLDTLLGLEVTIWADDDQIVNLEVDTDEDNIKFDTIVKKDSDDEVVYLYVDDEEYDWAKNAEVYVNFEEEKLDKIPADAYGYFVLNDDDEVAYANLFDFGEVEAGVVFKIDDDEYEFVDRTGDEETLDLSDYDDGVFVYNEKFEVIDIDDVDVNSAIYAWEDSDELYLVVKNSTVSGELEKVKNDEVKIDGENYDKAYDGAAYSDDEFDSFKAYSNKDSLDDINGEEVTAVLDLNDEVQLIFSDTKATSATKYAVVTYADFGSKAEVEVVIPDAEGDEEEAKYEFDDRSDAKPLRDIDEDYWFDSVEDGLEFAIMQFKLNKDGDIDDEDLKIELVENSLLTNNDAPAIEKDSDEDVLYLVDKDGDKTKFYIDEDTVFMTALDDESELDPKVISYKSIYESEFKAESDERAVILGKPGKDADMVVFIDPEFEGVDDDVYFGVVTEDVGTAGNGDDDIVAIDVFEKGEDDYVLEDEDDFGNGDIVAFKMNTDDEAKLDKSYDIIEDRYVKFDKDEDGDKDDDYVVVNGESMRLAKGVVVWILDEDKEADDPGKVKDIADYKYFKAVRDDDNKGEIVAITLREELKDSDEGGSEGDEGTVDYVGSNRIIIDGDRKEIDEDTILYDKDGKKVLAMGEDIQDELKEGMRVEVIEYDEDDEDLIVELKLLGDPIDKSDLEDAIEDAEDFLKDNDEDDYDSDLWNDLEDALKDAEEVMEDSDDEEEIEDAVKAIEDAIDALEDSVGGDEEITVTVRPTESTIGVVVEVKVEGYDDAATYMVETAQGEDVALEPVDLGDEAVTFGVKEGDTVKVTLYDADGEVIAEDVEVEVEAK